MKKFIRKTKKITVISAYSLLVFGTTIACGQNGKNNNETSIFDEAIESKNTMTNENAGLSEYTSEGQLSESKDVNKEKPTPKVSNISIDVLNSFRVLQQNESIDMGLPESKIEETLADPEDTEEKEKVEEPKQTSNSSSKQPSPKQSSGKTTQAQETSGTPHNSEEAATQNSAPQTTQNPTPESTQSSTGETSATQASSSSNTEKQAKVETSNTSQNTTTEQPKQSNNSSNSKQDTPEQTTTSNSSSAPSNPTVNNNNGSSAASSDVSYSQDDSGKEDNTQTDNEAEAEFEWFS